ncbi:MAG: hypothetical protein WBB95_27295 [Pseudomonas sp.]|uniref:hypothetical protein n=1 Tax=Pseudomonas sp. TaxID=306 RepID=UPI003C74CF05
MSMSIAAARVSGNVPLASDVRSAEPVTTSPAPTVPLHGVAAQTPPASTWRRFLADQDNLDTLALRLRGMAPWVTSNLAPSLNKNALEVHPDSAYASAGRTSVTLAAFITDLGYTLPTTSAEFAALALALEQRVALHPLGNFGAGLSWPIPMSQEDQRAVLRFLDTQKPNVVPGAPLPVEGLGMGTLAYFLSGSSLTQNDLQNPAKAINRLLDSPKAEALGQALQARLKGAPSDVSVYEYALTAIQLSLDPESARTPARNTIANFDLAQPEHWGQAPAQVIERLGSHLVAKGRATTSSAKLASHLLLARTAPQFLIKDIPQHVTIGSLAWANLSIAAAAIEAERPGTVAQMTFADVMRHSSVNENRSKAVDYAQTTVLVDWGIANGVIVKNAEDTYTTDQLKTVSAAFNQQLNDRLSASQALDQEIPTRKDIALTKLKARFGDLGALFEEKVLGTDQYRGEPEQTGLGGMHSLLDIAMMDLPNVRPFTSTDPRIPLEALNSNLTFGVREAFDQQFNGAIEAKKAAINTTVRHLISQMPLGDRQQFEYGKVTFFQEGSYKLGTDLFGSTPGPNKPGLLVKTELNGETHVYEINFNAGRIERTVASRANIQNSREADTVFTTQEFKPQGMPGNLDYELLTNKPLLNSFNSDRSHAIGSAFAQHLELNDPAIKEQARGQTTLESLQGGPKPLSEFLLNLVPFRSAIVNFQQGNYGEGALDLTLDIFGFLTAGAATAGKLLKIGSSALSTGAKTLRAARVIGAASIGVLNPVSGLGDLAVGSVKLLGNGGRYLLSRGADAVNLLKGASGSYDLLKAASKHFGVAAAGTYTVAGIGVEGAAVLHSGKWHAFDPVRRQPYGAALVEFKPATIAGNGEINSNLLNWLAAVVAPNPKTANLSDAFRTALTTAKGNDLAAYTRGYVAGRAENIPGYFPTMNVSDLKELAITAGRKAEDVGTLAKLIENRQIRDSLESFRVFNEEVATAGGKSTAMPQNFYLSQSDLPSKGECAALANTMALAIQHGKAEQLAGNFFKASTNTANTTIAAFRKELNGMHQILRTNFHGTQPFSQLPYTEIIERLRGATTSTTLKISTKNHGLLAGVTLNNNQKEWFFFDPNFGLAKFPDQASMERGLELTLNSGRAGRTLDPVAVTRGIPEYDVSVFSDGDFLTTVPYQNPFALFNAPL